MGKLRKKDIAWLLFWLLVFVPIKPFFSERPYAAARPPLTKGDIGSSHPQAHIYHGLSCGEDHINATLAHADVTRWLNPTIILSTLAKMVVVAVIVVMVVYVFLMATFCCCHVGVHWAISGRYIRPRIDKRSTIQVLISGCGKTEMVTVRTDSPGKELYCALKKRSLLKHQHILTHGVSIIRTGLSIGQQGIGHLSTAFILPVIGNGGGGTRLDLMPTLPQLLTLQGRVHGQHIDIVKGIGMQWKRVGTILLDDKDGTAVSRIAYQHGNNTDFINMDILGRWIQGEGIPDRTWQGLLGVLKMVHCIKLAESVEEALAAKEAEQDDQPQHSHPPLRHCPPLQTLSPIQHFQEYLKSYYSHQMDPEATWPPSPSKVYINLAIIDREETSTIPPNQLMLATLYKGVDTILKSKGPVKMEQILDTPPGTKQHCVLVEGAPGVGKTTLSWEICRRWAEGNLFNQYTLVLLLRLRDEMVQTAETLKGLVLYPCEERLDDITRYLKDTGGSNTLIILEGLDELPQHLLTRPSIFTRLLAGTELPNATIVVTSRPSATAQLWKQWKQRISKHIEITGFTEENITAYAASILGPHQLPDFNTYISTAHSIKQMMYIPLHCGIVVELYRMRSNTDKPLPTTKTALYTNLVRTILTRHLAKHPKYKDDEIDVEDFANLPDDIKPVFMHLTELAYESVTRQQLIIKDKDKTIQHFGFMHTIVEQVPNKRKLQHSYTFLHLSVQEYLGAVYMSLMDTNTQERLVESMCRKHHVTVKNMIMFLAAVTKFSGRNWEIIKQMTQSDCKEKDGTLTLSRYAIQMVFESEDVSLLEGHSHYIYELDESGPLFDFTALGYCIATSNYKWKLQLGGALRDMETTSGVDLLLHALHYHSRNRYTIESIECYYKDPEVVQWLLAGLPHNTLPLIKRLVLCTHTAILLRLLTAGFLHTGSLLRRPLPQCLPELVHKMDRLCVLRLWGATAATLADTLQALATAPTCTLETFNLWNSQFSPPAMHCALLRHSKSMTELVLSLCDITDEQACLLATALNGLIKLRKMDLHHNAFGDEGAVAIATALNGLPELREVELSYNAFRDKGAVAIATSLNRRPKLRKVNLSETKVTGIGRKALENWGKNNTQVELRY